ncbi:10498_t:CDS:2 [Funneliformis geosporum]|uniref:15994_t:CDS:1 n=1 Tax=Funneliformis geosporum TaxID=1117311 RepID=A0A9W4SLN0_9GLOM|nr:15994_t:CDS:2 [Funneliformis geosporum]CAI2175406.1 10498_t:CDS:2 [Funneliformis geosporum]
MSRLTLPINFHEMSVFNQYFVAIICIFFLLIPSVLVPEVSAQNLPTGQCVTEFKADNDYFTDKVTVETASLFSIEYFNHYKLVTNKQTQEVFGLYQCGTVNDLPANVKPFPVSINSVAVTDTSSNAFLDMLGLRSVIKVLGSADLISSPCIQYAKDNGDITILSTNETLNAIELGNVDLIFGATDAAADKKSVSVSSSNDPGVLNRVEWIKFYSVFFNAESKANEVYGKIKSNYECFKNLVGKNTLSNKPVVAWVAYEAPSEFNQNTAAYKIADAMYKMQLTEDAGGVYFNSTTLSYSNSVDFLKAIENVDILIDETFVAPTLDDVYKNFELTPNQQYKFIKNQAIYREDGLTGPNDGRDWFENAVVMGDALLEDMINVVNPKLPKSDYQRIWLRNVAKNEPIKISSSNNCSDLNQPSFSKADDCSALPSVSVKGDGVISSTPTFFSYLIAFVISVIFSNISII